MRTTSSSISAETGAFGVSVSGLLDLTPVMLCAGTLREARPDIRAEHRVLGTTTSRCIACSTTCSSSTSVQQPAPVAVSQPPGTDQAQEKQALIETLALRINALTGGHYGRSASSSSASSAIPASWSTSSLNLLLFVGLPPVSQHLFVCCGGDQHLHLEPAVDLSGSRQRDLPPAWPVLSGQSRGPGNQPVAFLGSHALLWQHLFVPVGLEPGKGLASGIALF